MDPGSRRDKVKVYNKVFTETDFGHSYALEWVGDFYVQFIEVTRSTFYSGSEKLNTSDIEMYKSAVRIVFDMDYRFNEELVEFHHDGDVYLPTGRGLRLGSTRVSKYSYNCSLASEIQGRAGSGSGSYG